MFGEPQPNAYGVEPAVSTPCEAGGIVGDTRRGGSCNFEQITLISHCNGTHTECIGHILNERISVVDCLKDILIPSVLVTVEPVSETDESYAVDTQEGDRLITRSLLSEQLGSATDAATALVIRTLPNDDGKLTAIYDGSNVPPYFTTEAMHLIVASGFTHLLVDMPSIDRLYDDGRLSNHRIFWNVEQGSFAARADSRFNSTITELIYVPQAITDGEYMLNLQIPPFMSDAAPSRPILLRR
jgi:arylformamidase